MEGDPRSNKCNRYLTVIENGAIIENGSCSKRIHVAKGEPQLLHDEVFQPSAGEEYSADEIQDFLTTFGAQGMEVFIQ